MGKKFSAKDCKVGMELKCIDGFMNFNKGNIYTIIEVDSEAVWVEDSTELYIPFYKEDFVDNLADYFKIVEEKKKEKTTTMENKTTKAILAPFGVEYLYDNVFKQAKLLEITEETRYEDWIEEDILILEEIPHHLSYDKVLELINSRLIIEFRETKSRLLQIRVKNEEDKRLAQQEKEAKEDRRKQYKELKKEFGKKENK